MREYEQTVGRTKRYGMTDTRMFNVVKDDKNGAFTYLMGTEGYEGSFSRHRGAAVELSVTKAYEKVQELKGRGHESPYILPVENVLVRT